MLYENKVALNMTLVERDAFEAIRGIGERSVAHAVATFALCLIKILPIPNQPLRTATEEIELVQSIISQVVPVITHSGKETVH